MEIIISNNKQRAARERALKVMAASGVDPQDFTIHQSSLLIAQQVTSRTNYTFNLYESQSGAELPRERLLNRNDAFFATHIGLYLLFEDTTSGSEVPISNNQFVAYPDPTIFAGAGEAAGLEAFYNAQLTLKTGPNERIKNFDTNNLRYLPEFDQPLAWEPAPGKKHGLFELAGDIVLDGAQDNVFTLDLNSDADTSAAVGIADQNTYIFMHVFGNIVLQGARKVGQYLM